MFETTFRYLNYAPSKDGNLVKKMIRLDKFAILLFGPFKLIGMILVVLTLSACQSLSITYTAKATGYDREVTIPIEVVTQSKPSPTVIVAHPSDGLDWNRYVRFWGSLLKSWGYNVILPDSFYGRGFRNKEVMYRAGLVNYDQRAEDMVKVAEWINEQKWHTGKIGIIGFSHGGGAVIRTANVTTLISAGVAYYPGCFTDDGTTNPKFPVQIHIGSNDTWTTSSRCVNLAKRSSIYDLYLYEGASHSFDIPASTRVLAGHSLSYDPIATKAAEERTRLFFKKYLD